MRVLWTVIAMSCLLALAASLAGCGAGEPRPAAEVPAVHEPLEAMPPSGQLVEGVREVSVRAFRYGYDPDPIVVHRGERVRIIAGSDDVAHGLGVNEYDLNLTLSPQEDVTAEFTADRAGRFPVLCTVYCGPDHSDMRGELIVLE